MLDQSDPIKRWTLYFDKKDGYNMEMWHSKREIVTFILFVTKIIWIPCEI